MPLVGAPVALGIDLPAAALSMPAAALATASSSDICAASDGLLIHAVASLQVPGNTNSPMACHMAHRHAPQLRITTALH